MYKKVDYFPMDTKMRRDLNVLVVIPLKSVRDSRGSSRRLLGGELRNSMKFGGPITFNTLPNL